jgi:cytochrome c oxidase assembly protein subunit 15
MKAQDATAALPALRRIAMLCVALMAVVVVASAFLRHLGTSAALQSVWADELALARQLHRVAATLALIGAVVMVVLARRAHSSRSGLAWSLLGVGLLLSAIGIAAGASRAAPVVLVNLLGGLAMLALTVRLAASDSHVGIGRAAWIMLGLVALQAAGGALASTSASAECVGLGIGQNHCSAYAQLHRVSGLLLGYALIVFGMWDAFRLQRRRRSLLALNGLALLLLGMLAAGMGSTTVPLVIVMHNALGAAAVAWLVSKA